MFVKNNLQYFLFVHRPEIHLNFREVSQYYEEELQWVAQFLKEKGIEMDQTIYC